MATIYKKRILDSLLERALSGIGAVVIEGPKGCGKTTTGLQLAKSKLMLVFSFVNSLMYLEFAIPLRRACAI